MKFRNIRIAIFQAGFNSNADFAQAIGIHESVLSRVLNGRSKLKADQVDVWIQKLACDPNILNEIIGQESNSAI